MVKQKSLFIVFEGLEGSGKSTQAGLLASRLMEAGYDIKATREPGGTRIGELIRQITHSRDNVDLTAVAEGYLMAASRAQHIREIIRPALSGGKIVICDRFLDSSLAYQGYGRELGEEKMAELNKLALDGIKPDLVIFLDLQPDLGFSRRNGSGKIDRLDLQQSDFYARVYRGYKKLAEKNRDKYFIVDSSKPVEEAAAIIWKKVKSLL
ncbi:MAG: thymidylate kinase, dTMP kinase [Candidatus Gottesmanbacteria bacterium GW2011_GWA2_43_14]|uniref:Thymidylate kinase n=1 Tax=Candidatus Gottesmanbacteria bacterium GW2011_GWA2_43_14 TaxID=1618443 RepID=A0A0G1DIB4_9BACT|nr:MAG: thymidylate kinase, dTMP kinase [Candidatus Gottesmanbacteria bacterium GW2011_GWA2_43_14]